MNFTLALLAGLVLLLPGVTALSSWNYRGGATRAKRPDLQLTSTTALFIVLTVAIAMHVLGFGLVNLIWASGLELGQIAPASFQRLPLLTPPYDMAVALATGGPTKPTSTDIFVFVLMIIFESLLAWRLMASEGLDILMETVDVHSQGWVFEHIVRPSRHGYKPIAWVLTNPPQGEYGVGYQGVVAEVRQGDNGELKFLSLAQPESFIYQIGALPAGNKTSKPKIEIHDRKWIGGVVALEASTIRNVVIQNVSDELVREVTDDGDVDGDDQALAVDEGKAHA